LLDNETIINTGGDNIMQFTSKNSVKKFCKYMKRAVDLGVSYDDIIATVTLYHGEVFTKLVKEQFNKMN
jgi:hypothetical protein